MKAHAISDLCYMGGFLSFSSSAAGQRDGSAAAAFAQTCPIGQG
jgi:hypothetical protein